MNAKDISAFPSNETSLFLERAPDDKIGVLLESKGMTLRDYFAAKSLQGMNASRLHFNTEPSVLASFAYADADAMLAERSKS